MITIGEINRSAAILRRNVLTIFILSALAIIILQCNTPASAQMVKPARIAVLSSSGVNNDYRSWNEYDDTLKAMGWTFDKYRNTELPTLTKNLGNYDLLLTTSLWNYGDAQDMKQYIPALRRYLENGGVILFTDMSYAPMCDWLKTLNPDLAIPKDAEKVSGARAQIDTTQHTPMLTTPNEIAGFNFWSDFAHQGKKWNVLLRTKAGTALMLGTPIGRGALIVTTTFALDSFALQNVYALTKQLKQGLIAYLNLPSTLPYPGKLRGYIDITNITDAERLFPLQISVTGKKLAETFAAQAVLIQSHATRTARINLAIQDRGRFVVTLSPAEGLLITHECAIPPLLSMKCNRYILTRNDDLIITTHLAVQPGMMRQTRLLMKLKTGRHTIQLNDGHAAAMQSFRVPASMPGPGRFQLIASATVGKEHETQQTVIDVRKISQPPSICRISSQGHIMVNGKAFFPLGTYHIGVDQMDTIKRMGFNCTTGPLYGGHAQSLNTAEKSFMDEAARKGMWVLQELSEYVRTPERNFEDISRMVSELRLFPSTLLYYAVDEPNPNSMPPELISHECAILHACDPEHPSLVLQVPGEVILYSRCGDMTGTDPYPIGSSVDESLASVASAVGDAVKSAQGRPLIAAIQAHRQPPAGSKNRYPTPAELRCMSYLALNHGAKGILYYAWSDTYQFDGKIWPSGFAYDTTLMQAFPKLLSELRVMGMKYVMGDVKRLPAPLDAPTLDMVTIRYRGETTLVAVNPTAKELDTSLKIGGNVLKHHFDPFEVMIMKL
jgi:hypothetical protein